MIQSPKRLSFRQFIDRVRPGFKWYRHCVKLAEVLQRAADGELKRLMIWMPPRHGKSELVSRLFPAYFLYLYGNRWAAITSYGAELAHTLSRNARDFYCNAGAVLKDDAKAVKHWETGRGGGLWASGVGGPATGKGMHLGVVDDPLKDARDAASELIRERQKDWYLSVFTTREEPWDENDLDALIILVQTRWVEDDLSGWQLEEERKAYEEDPEECEGWHIVCFEAIKTDFVLKVPPSCTVEPDWREVGEALCPERRPLSRLLRIKRRIGDYFWEALYQQRPSPKEGTFFKVSKLGFLKVAPAGLRLCRAWDKGGSSKKRSAYTSGVLIGEKEGMYYVLDVVRGQWDIGERDAMIRQTAVLDGYEIPIRGPQDPGQAGIVDANAFIKLLAGFDVTCKPVSGDKPLRASPFASQLNSGNVVLIEGPWNREFIEELRQCPTGKYWDQIDAAADSFNEIADAEQIFELL